MNEDIESTMSFDGSEVAKGMKSIEDSVNNVTKAVDSLIQHFDKLDKKISETNKLDLGSAKYVTHGSAGTMTSDTGRGHIYKEYQQAIINETNAITEDIEQRKKFRQQRADTEKKRTENEAKRISKIENQNSAAYQDRQNKLAEAKLLNAKANQIGANLRNPRIQFGNAIRSVGGKLGGVGVGSDKLEGRFVGGILSTLGVLLKSPLAGAAAGVKALASGIIDLGKASTQAYAEIESIKTQLGVVFSSQTQSEAIFSDISKYAVRSPFGVQQTSELAVLLKQSGVYASDLMSTLRMIGDTAGGNMEKMKRIANNYAQIVSIGKASMLDMRQFAYAGIPIFEAVSKELGVSQQELRKLISDGKVTSDIIEKVFKDLTGINGLFENATEKGAKTLKARSQNLADIKQLAFSEVGNSIVNMETTYGNDSLGIRLVSGLESIYARLKDFAGTKNIERDVKTIASSDRRIRELKELLQFAKDTGDTRLADILERKIEEQNNLFDVETKRSIYAKSYDIKTEDYEKYSNKYGIMSSEDIDALLEYYIGKKNEAEFKIKGIQAGAPRSGRLSSQAAKNIRKAEEEASVHGEIIKDLENYKKAIEARTNLTEEEIKAQRERFVESKQASTFDKFSKEADREGSYAKGFEKLFSGWTSSPEYKKLQEEKELNFLRDSKKRLDELLKYSDENGNVDITKMSFKQYTDYLNNTKSLSPSHMLTLTEGVSESQMDKSRPQLLAQWKDISNKIVTQLGSKGAYGAVESFQTDKFASQLSDDLDNSTLFNNLDTIVKKQLDVLEALKNNATPKDKKFYEDLQLGLMGSTFGFTVNKEASKWNENLGDNNTIFPLWKRILASATGLSVENISSTSDTLDTYRNEVSPRNLAASVLPTIAKEIGVSAVSGIIKTSGNAKKLPGDTGYTYQVDWQATGKALHSFATQLSASTTVVSAYKAALEKELDVYTELYAAGFTTDEDASFTKQRNVSAKTLAKASQFSEQLVNAFGEELTTADGRKVKFNGTDFVDEQGNVLQEEQVQLTGNLFKIIQEELPKIRENIHEANVAELQNSYYNSLYKAAAGQFYEKMAVYSEEDNRKRQFLYENPDYQEGFIRSKVKAYIEDENTQNILKEKYGGKAVTVDDIFAFFLRESSSDENEQFLINFAKTFVDKALSELESSLNFLDDEGIKKLENIKYFSGRDSAMYAWMMNQKGITPYDVKSLKGSRGASARALSYLGYNNNFDVYDLIINKAIEDKALKELKEKTEAEYKKQNPEATPMQVEQEGQNAVIKSLKADKTGRFSSKFSEFRDEIETLQLSEMMDSLGESIEKLGVTLLQSGITDTFYTWGKHILDADRGVEAMGDNFKKLGQNLTSNMGSLMTEAGLAMIIGSAGIGPKLYAGLALVAAGGGLSFLSGVLDSDTKEDDKEQRLNKLKDDLVDLLRQAREDAIYYENTLRHKNAISANENLTVRSVNDAIITPSGDIITTHPDDYLIATKEPRNLVSGSAPTVNFNVIDKSTGIRITEQKYTYNKDTNSLDFEAVIESKVNEIIMSSKSDEAFAVREARMRGKTVIA